MFDVKGEVPGRCPATSGKSDINRVYIPEKCLAIDVGGGTQDILLFDPEKNMENCIQLVLPSPTRLVARKIKHATEEKKAIYLGGVVMGGGPSARAVREHLKSGLKVYAAKDAALTIDDNLERVEASGVIITEEPPGDAVRIKFGDVDIPMLTRILGEVGEELPANIAVAVQDHGFSPYESNRLFRFRLWERFMEGGGHLKDLVYLEVPEEFNRMKAAQKTVPGALLMDTCGAALIGALTDERVCEAARDGVLVVNVGNQHTFAAVVQGEKVLALLEHHTRCITPAKLRLLLARFLDGQVTNDEIREDGGHGCYPPKTPLSPVLRIVTGPNRGILKGENFYEAAPQGNMMLMGPFGLVKAFEWTGRWKEK